ncbi:quinone oxidoreductase family protein [Caenispirillum salinarum]|uniref:quinone oxidoreductase family protein n=1 Tax=Caenispirillum salinarum TaxID=859058 RepID=UPI0038514835
MATQIRIHETGGPEVMKVETVDIGAPGPGEVRLRQSHCGVNFIDTYHRTGLYPVPLPSGIGLEGLGVVEARGDGVTEFEEGDRVFYATGPIGGYADKRLIPSEKLVRVPENLSDDQIGGHMLRALTAQYLLRRLYKVQPGEQVLFHAGAGGLGQIAIQWLKHIGAEVITTVGSDEKAEVAKKLGADHVINYSTEDFVARVKEITNGVGVPVVYDGVGKTTWEGSLDCLKGRGMMVSFGNASGSVESFSPGILSTKGSLFLTRPTLMGYCGTRPELIESATDVFEVIGTGAVTIEKATVYPLKDAVQAHKDLEGRKIVGSTVLMP